MVLDSTGYQRLHQSSGIAGWPVVTQYDTVGEKFKTPDSRVQCKAWMTRFEKPTSGKETGRKEGSMLEERGASRIGTMSWGILNHKQGIMSAFSGANFSASLHPRLIIATTTPTTACTYFVFSFCQIAFIFFAFLKIDMFVSGSVTSGWMDLTRLRHRKFRHCCRGNLDCQAAN